MIDEEHETNEPKQRAGRARLDARVENEEAVKGRERRVMRPDLAGLSGKPAQPEQMDAEAGAIRC